DANDLPTALWRFCNNLDPKRDHLLYKASASAEALVEKPDTGDKVQDTGDEAPATSNQQPVTINGQPETSNYIACIGFDGTRKTKEFDDFHRDWPNIIVADNATIEAVDEKWN